jgi:hypothetical protein
MHFWDILWSDEYKEDEGIQRRMTNARNRLQQDPGLIFDRTKIMRGLAEAELDYLRGEEEFYTSVTTRRAEVEQENAELTARLARAEAELRAKREEKAGELEIKGDEQPEAEGSQKAADESGEAGEGPLEEYPSARLRKLDWTSFRYDEGDPCAIDVLDGEPVVTFTSLYPQWKVKKTVAKEAELAIAPKKRQLAPGQGPLPERIRINSAHIMKILGKIDAETFGDEEPALVMIRPFKALAYYEDQIRHIHQELLDRHSGTDKPADEEGTAGADTTKKDQPTPKAVSGEAREDDGREEENQQTTPLDEVLKDPFTSSAVALEQLQVLVDFYDTEIKAKVDYLKSEQCHRVSFTDLWHFFKPGDEVIDQGGKQAYTIIGITSSSHKVISRWRNLGMLAATSDETPFMLHCVHIDFDGKSLGPVLKTFSIPRFDGEKAVNSFTVYPLRFAASRGATTTSQPSTRQKLIDRGKMFVHILSQQHMHYSGLTLGSRDEVDGQVVIDFEKAFEMAERDRAFTSFTQSASKPELEADDLLAQRYRRDRDRPVMERERDESDTHDSEKEEQIRRPKILSLMGVEHPKAKEESCTAGCCTNQRVHRDSYAEGKRNEAFRNSLIPEELSREPSVAIYPRPFTGIRERGGENSLTDEEYLIMSYRVFGFILRSRRWGKENLNRDLGVVLIWPRARSEA